MWIIDYSHLSERELEAIQSKIGKTGEELKVFIADILSPKTPNWAHYSSGEYDTERMRELERLVTSFWGVVIVDHIQKRSFPDYKTYIGSGKLDEIMGQMHCQWAQLLVMWNILKPHQIHTLNNKLKNIWAVCWDRVDLILKIFEKNAQSEEAKLQI